MKPFVVLMLVTSAVIHSHALLISEVMSNPIGDDSGREWVEIYNNAQTAVDLSLLTISIKGGSYVVVTPVQGGTSLPAGGYAIIGSVVTGATKFLQDYPSYTGILMRSSISLVNTGVTSIDVKLGSTVADSLPTYTATKEGYTLSLVSGSFVQGSQTPGAENQASLSDSSSGSSSSTSTESQIVVPQMSPPSPDMTLYLPFERTVVAGAEVEFMTSATTRAGKPLDNLTCMWAYGDGGQGKGTSTLYRYAYPGTYIAQVEGTTGLVSGLARMTVRVVSPDIHIVQTGTGKYGAYVDIENPNTYDIDLSQWRLIIQGVSYPFPKNTLMAPYTKVRFSGLAMGFASTTFFSSSTVKIVFPNLEEVTTYLVPATPGTTTSSRMVSQRASPYVTGVVHSVGALRIVATSSPEKQATTSVQRAPHRDTRIVSFLKSLVGK